EPATAPGSVAATVQTDAAEAETAPGARGAPGIVSIEDFDSTLYFLDDEEIAYLKAEVEREYK
ncbi:MAG: hypothetical protein GWN71_31080, partial [Gammaproteobacteria bacterium]|nr:hypothetical protein [Gemmatimonadota bacterium]NIU77836.1 hypothetical protein [Gammaproteobacteria bacterium]